MKFEICSKRTGYGPGIRGMGPCQLAPGHHCNCNARPININEIIVGRLTKALTSTLSGDEEMEKKIRVAISLAFIRGAQSVEDPSISEEPKESAEVIRPDWECSLPCCLQQGPRGFTCTRNPGHDGEHRAWGSRTSPVIEVWNNE